MLHFVLMLSCARGLICYVRKLVCVYHAVALCLAYAVLCPLFLVLHCFTLLSLLHLLVTVLTLLKCSRIGCIGFNRAETNCGIARIFGIPLGVCSLGQKNLNLYVAKGAPDLGCPWVCCLGKFLYCPLPKMRFLVCTLGAKVLRKTTRL